MGINTIAASINQGSATIEEVYAPCFMQLGFLDCTPRGRVGTRRAFAYFKIAPPTAGPQNSLF